MQESAKQYHKQGKNAIESFLRINQRLIKELEEDEIPDLEKVRNKISTQFKLKEINEKKLKSNIEDFKENMKDIDEIY